MAKEYTPNFNFVLPTFDQEPWHDDYYAVIRSIDALLAKYISVNNLQGAWQNSTQYLVGQTVIDFADGSLWVVNISHTSPASPATFAQSRISNPTYWSPGAISVHARGAWTTGTQYAIGDFVVNGNIYAIAKTAHTSGVTFAGDVAFWDYLIDATATVNAAAASAAAALVSQNAAAQSVLDCQAEVVLATAQAGIATTQAGISTTQAGLAAASAAASEASAQSIGARLVSTSTSNMTIGTGPKTCVVEANDGWAAQMSIKVYQTSVPTNFMVGTVTSYNPATGDLAFTVAAGDTSGSGAHTDWTIIISGVRGQAGANAINDILQGFPTVATTTPGAAYAMDLNVSNYFDITLSAASCTLSFSNIPSNTLLAEAIIIIRQDNTGSRTVTWPGNVYWSGGTPPVLSTVRNQADMFLMTTRDNGATWFAVRLATTMMQFIISNTTSADFNGTSQWLSMSDGNFGAYTYAKFAIALRFRADTIGGVTKGIINHQNSGAGFNLSILTSAKLRLRSQGGDGIRETSASLSTATWYNCLIHMDTSTNTMRIFLNSSTEQTYGGSSGGPTIQMTDPGGNFEIGSCQYAGDIGVCYFDGLISEFGFWDNVLPTYDDVFPPSLLTGQNRNWRAISGLKSWLRMGDNGLLVDEILGSTWTNNGTVTTSGTVP